MAIRSGSVAIRRTGFISLLVLALTMTATVVSGRGPTDTEDTTDISDLTADNGPDPDAEHITVSARKRHDPLLGVPVTVTRFSASQLEALAVRDFADYATLTPSLSFAYGNGATAGDAATAIGNARTIAIRGVAGARTTGFYLDDTPMPGAVDVRVLDLSGIEVLKGPQGTLFGESSLGGNVRLLSNAPDPGGVQQQVQLAGGRVDGSDAWSHNLEVISNLVLRPDSAALRLSAYADHDAGYLQRSYQSDPFDAASPRITVDNQAARTRQGGAMSTRLLLSDAMTLDARLVLQQQHYHGFPASYAPLPAFEPLAEIDHLGNVQPFVRDRWSLPSVTLRYDSDSWHLLSTLSYFDRDTEDLEDSTEGTAQYWGTTLPQTFAWTALHRAEQWSHETRLQFDPTPSLSATVGVFYSDLVADFDIPAIYGQLGSTPGPSSLLWLSTDRSRHRDLALFSEWYYRLQPALTLTLGARQYWLEQDNDLYFEILTTQFRSRSSNRDTGVNPKLALDYALSAQTRLYVSAAEGFRAGGAQFNPAGFGCEPDLAELGLTPDQMTRIAADSTRSYELGGKHQWPQSGLLLTGALFRIDWDNIQQQLFLPSCGFYMRGNAGAAEIEGAELELVGRWSATLQLRLGIGYQDARISKGGSTGQQRGERIYQTPEWTGTLAASNSHTLTPNLQAVITGSYSYTGDSVSANSSPDRRLHRTAYELLNLRFALQWQQTELAMQLSNVTNERPNLGDIGYIGYTRFESDGVTPRPQVATLPPRTVMLQLRHAF